VHYVGRSRRLTFTPIHLESAAVDVEIRTIEPMRVAFLRHVGPYDQVGRTWEELTNWAGRECLFGPGTNFFGMCWDDPEVTPPSRLRYDACVTLADPVLPEGEIGVATVAGGRYAVVLHEGAYNRVNETYAALLAGWFPEHGYEPGDPPSLEFYLNDPDTTEAEDLLTEVCMPIGERW
jgi:AraC family transcriptional regulator